MPRGAAVVRVESGNILALRFDIDGETPRKLSGEIGTWFDGQDCEIEVREGNVASTVLDAARQREADLVIPTTRGTDRDRLPPCSEASPKKVRLQAFRSWSRNKRLPAVLVLIVELSRASWRS